MGMFDWVVWHGPLPKSRDRSKIRIAMEDGAFQSKSVKLWEDSRWASRAYENGGITITVDQAGQMIDPDGENMLWSGTLRFYGGGRGVKFTEFSANFKDGIAQGIERIINDH